MDGTVPPSPAPRTLTVQRVDGALSLALPDDLADRLQVTEGTTVYVAETPTGLSVTSLTPEEEKQLRIGREFMVKYRKTFAALAK